MVIEEGFKYRFCFFRREACIMSNRNIDRNIEGIMGNKGAIQLVRYKNLLIQPGILLYDKNKPDSPKMRYYNDSLAHARSNNYTRHLKCKEYFGIQADYLDGNFSGELAVFSENLRESDGDWFYDSIMNQKDKLICYAGPENLRFDMKENYFIEGGKLLFNEEESEELDFKIGSSTYWRLIKVKELGDAVSMHFFGRSIGELPAEMREGAAIHMPPEGMLRPIGRGSTIDTMYRICCYYSRASRGVREISEGK